MKRIHIALIVITLAPVLTNASDSNIKPVSDETIKNQNISLQTQTKGKGFGPQSPRDIDSKTGENKRIFSLSPPSTRMNLCNIHLHKNAEHKGGEFTVFAGNGNGQGYQTGYKYSGSLSDKELTSYNKKVGHSEHSRILSGDTLEVHYVYSTAKIKPGATLNSCFNESIGNPQLRVETQIYVAVNDKKAADFTFFTTVETVEGLYQAINLPKHTGTPVQYTGSTTGPSYNEAGSPFQVTWSVRPKIEKVYIGSIAQWFNNNAFNENHAHGVRNLVTQPKLLSTIDE
jgi:hypothetical protein